MTNCVNKILAQDYNYRYLPSLDSLLTILESSDSLQLDAELKEYKHTYRFSWVYLIPSVGYDLINNRPLVMFNSSGIISYFQNKRVVERKQISIESKAELSHTNNKIKLITYYNDLKSSIIQLDMTYETYKKYEQLYDLKVQQHKANEINTETFLKEQISFSEKKKIILTSIDFINDRFAFIELILNVQLFQYLTYNSYLNGN